MISAHDRSLEKRGLPVRMYRHGLAYRLVRADGTRAYLGRDLGEALRRYYALTAVADIDRDTKELTAAYIVARHRKGAKQRNLTFDVTTEDVDALLDAQGWCCAITGAAFSTKKVDGVRIRPYLPSLDRIDNLQGYHRHNVRVVCGFVNVAMKAFGEHLFSDVLRGLVDAKVRAEIRRTEMRDGQGSIPIVGSDGIGTGINHCA